MGRGPQGNIITSSVDDTAIIDRILHKHITRLYDTQDSGLRVRTTGPIGPRSGVENITIFINITSSVRHSYNLIRNDVCASIVVCPS